MPKGTLPLPEHGEHGPLHNHPLDSTDAIFTNVQLLDFVYYTDLATVQKIIPECFELSEKPVVIFRVANFGFNRHGQYREVMPFVLVTYEGGNYLYSPLTYVTQDAALIAGREPMGVPKLFANIEFNAFKEEPSSMVHMSMSRPAEVPLLYAVVRQLYYGGRVEDQKVSSPVPIDGTIALRSFPGDPPIRDLVISNGTTLEGDIWPCKGTIKFTGYSDIDDFQSMPVVEPISTTLTLNAKTIVHPAQKFIKL